MSKFSFLNDIVMGKFGAIASEEFFEGIKNDIGLYAAFELLGAKPPLVEQDHNALHDAAATLEVFHLFENEINK